MYLQSCRDSSWFIFSARYRISGATLLRDAGSNERTAMITDKLRSLITDRMRAAGMHPSAIQAFLGAVEKVAAGDTGLCPETDIDPVSSVPTFEGLPKAAISDGSLLQQVAVIKLNGGLGTGMGLDRAKSLIEVK